MMEMLEKKLAEVEDAIWEMEMGHIYGKDLVTYHRLLGQRTQLRVQLGKVAP